MEKTLGAGSVSLVNNSDISEWIKQPTLDEDENINKDQKNTDQKNVDEIVIPENGDAPVRLIRCRIKEAEYMEATAERINENDVPQLINKILVICEEVETGFVGGGILSAEDIAYISGMSQIMGSKEMIEFADRLNSFDGVFLMPVPEEGLIPLDTVLNNETKDFLYDKNLSDEKPFTVPEGHPIFPPLSPSELEQMESEIPERIEIVKKPFSLGEAFANKRKQAQESLQQAR